MGMRYAPVRVQDAKRGALKLAADVVKSQKKSRTGAGRKRCHLGHPLEGHQGEQYAGPAIDSQEGLGNAKRTAAEKTGPRWQSQPSWRGREAPSKRESGQGGAENLKKKSWGRFLPVLCLWTNRWKRIEGDFDEACAAKK